MAGRKVSKWSLSCKLVHVMWYQHQSQPHVPSAPLLTVLKALHLKCENESISIRQPERHILHHYNKKQLWTIVSWGHVDEFSVCVLRRKDHFNSPHTVFLYSAGGIVHLFMGSVLVWGGGVCLLRVSSEWIQNRKNKRFCWMKEIKHTCGDWWQWASKAFPLDVLQGEDI